MTVRVHLCIDASTGEVQLLQIDQDKTGGDADHARSHDRLATTIGGVIGRRPRVVEIEASQSIVAPQTVAEDSVTAEDSTSQEETRKLAQDGT